MVSDVRPGDSASTVTTTPLPPPSDTLSLPESDDNLTTTTLSEYSGPSNLPSDPHFAVVIITPRKGGCWCVHVLLCPHPNTR